MAAIVYALCFVTATGCAAALLLAWRRSRVPLLLFSGLCFGGLALNEAFVLIDLYVVPHMSLLVFRRLIGAVAIAAMLLALILHTNREERP